MTDLSRAASAAWRAALHAIFGEVSWTPPRWLAPIIALGGRAAAKAATLDARRIALWSGALIALLMLGFSGWVWYDGLPRPPLTTASAQAPGATYYPETGPLVIEPLRVRFEHVPGSGRNVPAEGAPIAKLELIGRPVVEGVRLFPAQPGEWKWESDSELVFTPSQDWPVGAEFRVAFGPEAFAPGVRLDSRSVQFTTPDLSVEVSRLELYVNPADRRVRQVVGTVRFSHPVDPESATSHLALTMRESGATIVDAPKPVEYTLRWDRHKREAYVLSAPIALPDNENFMRLKVGEGVRAASGPGRTVGEAEEKVRIPDVRTYFRVASAAPTIVRDDQDRADQVLVVTLTDEVAAAALAGQLEAWLLPTTRELPKALAKDPSPDVQIGQTGDDVDYGEGEADGEGEEGEVVYRAPPTLYGQSEYSWRTASEVTPEVLARAERVALDAIPNAADPATLHSYRIDAPPGRWLYLRVKAPLKSAGGFVMGQPWTVTTRVPNYPRDARIASEGSLLAFSGDRKLPLMARGVPALRFELHRVLEGEINHLVSQTYGDIRNPNFSGYAFDERDITELESGVVPLKSQSLRRPSYASLDLSTHLRQHGVFLVRVAGHDPDTKRDLTSWDRRLVIVSDLGMIVKDAADGSHDLFVQSIATGEPAAGVSIELLGRNGIAVLSGSTDAEGHLRMPSTGVSNGPQEPTVYVARRGSDVSFIPFSGRGRELEQSRFDIGGLRTAHLDSGEQLQAFAFTDRGLYRPGETAHLGAIVKRFDWRAVAGVPVELQVVDARGATVLRKRSALAEDGLVEVDLPTDPTSATGTWYLQVQLLGDLPQERQLIGSAEFKVEEFQPDRMRIKAGFEGERRDGWLAPAGLKARVELSNLFGTPAQGRELRAELTLTPTAFRFGAYKDWTFEDPLRDPSGLRQTTTVPLPVSTTDDEGVVTLAPDLSAYERGLYRATLAVEGFEAGGGRSVKAQTSTLLSPLARVVGWKADGELGWLDLNAVRQVELVALDPSGKPVATKGLKLRLSERRWTSTLVQRYDGTYAYQSLMREEPQAPVAFALGAKGARQALDTSKPGEWVLDVIDGDGARIARIPYTVAGNRNVATRLERDAELKLKLKDADVPAGGELELSIVAPYAGAGLITIEREKVFAYRWFRASTTSSVQRIRVPAGIEGNAYVSVAFVRDPGSPDVFLTPLSHAVLPFEIDRASRTIPIELGAPELVRPGDKLTVKYSTPKPARVLLFAVDEGILQVARYKTPDPLSFMMRKRALEVRTTQTVDMILPQFELLQQLAAAGGDEDAMRAVGKNLNPFRRKSDKPVAFWSGPLAAGPEAREWTIEVPDSFNGSMRVMALAVSPTAVGASEQPLTVRGPFVLTPNLPVTAAPGDRFVATVGVANNVEGSGKAAKVVVSALPSEQLAVDGAREQTVEVGEGREGRVSFAFKATDKVGPGLVRFEAKLGAERVGISATLSVRPATLYLASTQAGRVSGGADKVALDRTLLAPLARQEANASQSPLLFARGMTDWLQAFPHGCTEQLVSQAFPYLAFGGDARFGVDAARSRAAFEATLARLRSRQTNDGGFGYWPGDGYGQPFVTTYATHYLLDAKEQELPVPADVLDPALARIKSMAGDRVGSLGAARQRAWAIYLLTRSGEVTTNQLTDLHETLEARWPKQWKADLTAAYVGASYKLLQKPELADGLIGGYSSIPGIDALFGDDFDTQLGRDSQWLYLLSRHFPERLRGIDDKALAQILEPALRGEYNTLSAAWTALGLSAYGRAAEAAAPGLPQIAALDARDQLLSLALRDPSTGIQALPLATRKLRITNPSKLPAWWLASQAGFDAQLPAEARREGLEVTREYHDADGKAVAKGGIGDELTAVVKVRALSGEHSNVAIVDLLPGGFEVVADSARAEGWRADYVDVREDRVVFYGSVGPTSREFRYKVKLTAAGTFVVPAAYIEAMYDKRLRGNSQPAQFEVAPRR